MCHHDNCPWQVSPSFQPITVKDLLLNLGELLGYKWSRWWLVCPPQVSLLNSSKVELCGGVVLGRHSVLTSARCLLLDSGLELQPSSFYVRTGMEL